MVNFISVIIPTYNPNIVRLNQTLEGLKNQTLLMSYWELILVDNNSKTEFASAIDLSWHSNVKIVQEQRQGLTYARVKGFTEAMGEILVLVDDDNVLDKNYLDEVVKICKNNPSLGAFGGKSIPVFEKKQPVWLKEFYGNLALRDFGDVARIDDWQKKFPDHAPVGAGMVIRKKALQNYLSKVMCGTSVTADRTGNSLSSSGDNDIVLEILKSGWQSGYFPNLVLHHLIPSERLTVNYLGKLLNNTNKSWVLLLESHGVNPWARIPAWTVPLRKLKAWFRYAAWKGNANYIRWKGACGTYDGLSA